MNLRTLQLATRCFLRTSTSRPIVLCRPWSRHRCLSTASPNSGNDGQNRNSLRTRVLLFAGGFVLIHLSVVFSRRYHKKYKNQERELSEADSEVIKYRDSEIGRNKILQYKGYLLPYFVEDALKKLEKFPSKDGDIFVASFPKSGTTWVQEIVYLIATDLDLESARKENMEQRFPYLEFIYPGLREISKMPEPRLIKTHMPFTLLPAAARSGKGKIIYIARNPKDVTVSNFHFVKMLTEINYKGDFYTYFEHFLNDKVPYGPWWEHVLDYWTNRENTNVLFLTYEELQQDLRNSVKKVAHFLGKELNEKQITLITQHCGFKAMKRNPATNYNWWDELGLKTRDQEFMRKGIVGDWKNYFTSEMQERIDSKCQEKLAPHGLFFKDKIQ